MDQGEQKTEPTSPALFPSPARLLVFAVLLPAAVAISNQLLLEWAPGPWLRLLFSPWMAISAAVLGWCVGRYLSPPWLRWLVFGWCLVLLDSLTVAACICGNVERHFAFSMVLTQSSLIILWAVMATASWQWRLPVVLAAAAAVIVFSAIFNWAWRWENWSLLMLLATVVTLAVCSAIRIAGFALLQPNRDSPLDEQRALNATQFGLKHMLIWTTALVPILLVLRGADFVILKRLGGPDLFSLALLAIVLASVNLIAIWAVLGHGVAFLRVAALFAIPYFLAVGMSQYLEHVESTYVRSRGVGRWNITSYSNAWYDSLIQGIADERDSLVRFLCVNAALLAALLLFLRASGHRLAKSRR